MEWLLVSLAGAAAGFLGALLGIGGGSVLVPILVANLGVPVKKAVAASLASIIATSSMSSSVYLRRRLVNLRLAVALEATTILGSLTGANLTVSLPSGVVEFILGAVLLYSALIMIYRALRPPAGPKPPSSGGFTYYDEALGHTVSYGYRNLGAAAGFSYFAGMLSGMLGIGGGVVKVPILDLVAGVPAKVAVATSSYMIGVTAAAGSSVYLGKGLVDAGIVAAAVIGIIAGSRLGASIMPRLRSRTLRALFGAVLIYYAFRMMTRGMGL